jgi:hypothetical protein
MKNRLSVDNVQETRNRSQGGAIQLATLVFI